MATKPNTVDTSAWNVAGRNVKHTLLDGMLFIAIPVSDAVIQAAPLSGSGKSRSVASTEGNINIPGTSVKLGLNAYVPVKASVG